ncbi:hypothetical protein BDN70DRAFT_648151 [Pholiota conissans]|uniref:Uncharacterized protein n=1 Tax=Pholiota conissans TaxID=109636 RepID=A0A9P6CS84_9AGAR|nr:hypothetical protein BDN70DRAFT_648151 [Pholiota conissans]
MERMEAGESQTRLIIMRICGLSTSFPIGPLRLRLRLRMTLYDIIASPLFTPSTYIVSYLRSVAMLTLLQDTYTLPHLFLDRRPSIDVLKNENVGGGGSTQFDSTRLSSQSFHAYELGLGLDIV